MQQQGLLDIIDRMQAEAHGAQFLAREASRQSWENLDGEERKEAALQAVLEPKPAQTYRDLLHHGLLAFRIGDRFTVEQLTGTVGRPPEGVHFNSVGAIIAGMAKRGLIRDTGQLRHAQRPGMHATDLKLWELVKYA